MNRDRLKEHLADDGIVMSRGRRSLIYSARKEVMDALRSAVQSTLSGTGPIHTAAIRQALDDLDWLAAIDKEDLK